MSSPTTVRREEREERDLGMRKWRGTGRMPYIG